MTYTTLQFLDRCSIINFTQRFTQKTTVHITTTGNELLRYLEQNEYLALITKGILRTYAGIFDEAISVNLSHIASKTHTTEAEVISVLNKLQDVELLEFKHTRTDADIIFLVPREDEHTINRVAPYIKELRKSKTNKVASMIRFVQNESTCRSKQLLSYFGEKGAKECSICSVCISNANKAIDPEKIKHDILELLQKKQLSSREIISQLEVEEEIALKILQELNEHRIITINPNNNYQIV